MTLATEELAFTLAVTTTVVVAGTVEVPTDDETGAVLEDTEVVLVIMSVWLPYE